ncbi:MAG: hypothetical protein LUD50_04840 [Clostridia bacterium]|nr:hypothetical protein [Clostridia bacterium]
MDNTTYVITVALTNVNNETIASAQVDLPMESTVVGGTYDSENKQVTLTLTSGGSVSFSVADLVEGLVSQTDYDAKVAELEAADTALQANIDTEASTREEADTTLQTNITAEESARTAADTAEKTAREEADAAIQAQLDAMEYATSDDINALFEEDTGTD